MTILLQLAAALTAALASGCMGIALVPFLRKLRFCEPQQPDSQPDAAPRLLPTMGGLLLISGSLTGAVLTYTLYRIFCIPDTTSAAVQDALQQAGAVLGFTILCAAMGFAQDLQLVRRRTIRRTPPFLQFLLMFLCSGLFLLLSGMESTVLDFGFFRFDAGVFWLPLTAAGGALLWLCAERVEEQPDGSGICIGGIVLLCAAVMLMQEGRELHALLTLSAAGACMGCLVWTLHPAKCRLGATGRFWICGAVVAVSLIMQKPLVMLLLTAVYPVNLLPALRRHGRTLQQELAQTCQKPWQCIAVLAGFAALSGIGAML
ncbi:MAG: hypothetical protein E7502_03210 [Ruminococcus sp.]|nr:hypothetical protein [Ruminococcus sp.]